MKQLYEFLNKGRPLQQFSMTFLHAIAFVTVLLLLGVPTVSLFAQTSVTAHGVITDDAGSPLPGVNIIEKGTTNGTVSDSKDSYALVVGSGQSVLVFSFLGPFHWKD